MHRFRRAAIGAGVAALVLTACAGDTTTSTTSAPVGTTAPATTESPDTTVASSTTAAPTEAYSIWYVNPLPSFPTWGNSSDLFGIWAEETGNEATLVGPDAIDIPAMISSIEQAITEEANGILTCSLDPASFASVFDQAKTAGATVVTIGCVDDAAHYSIGTDNASFGALAADIMAEETGGTGRIAIIGTDQVTPNQVEIVEGFRARVAEVHPDLVEVVWEGDGSDAGIAAEVIGAVLAAHSDLDYLWLVEGAAPTVIPAVLAEAGLEPGELGVLGIDAPETTLEAIADGWITVSLNQCWFDASPLAGDVIVAHQQGSGPAEGFIPIPIEQVTADDLPYAGCDASSIPTLEDVLQGQ